MDFVNGGANGINDNAHISNSAAASLGVKALEATRSAIDSHSPSKETMLLGNNYGIGFVNGIKEYSKKVYSTAYNIGDTAKNGLNNSISKISSFINSDMDTNPTIRPVIDMTDVESKMGHLNDLFNRRTMYVDGNIQSISSSMNNRNQNGDNTEVVSAINKLSKSLEGNHGDVYNVNGKIWRAHV